MKCFNIDSNQYDVILFDVDGTTSLPNQPLTPEVQDALLAIMKRVPMGIGFNTSITSHELMSRAPKVFQEGTSPINLVTGTGNVVQRFHGDRTEILFQRILEPEQINVALDAINYVQQELFHDIAPYGDIYKFADGQIVYVPVGLNAPKSIKGAWDPSKEKRYKAAGLLNFSASESGLTFSPAGQTSVDGTCENKASGTIKLAESLGISPHRILCIDNEITEGNGHSIFKAQLPCIEVESVDETMMLLQILNTPVFSQVVKG
jgi:hydroxymethylpyrimidine pyrophosphatase-like HAD family hydrolase